MSAAHTPAAAVDLGKTACRVRLADGRVLLGPGAPGLASADGVSRALESIAALLTEAAVDRIDNLAVGAAGVESAPSAAQSFASELAHTWNAHVAVASDIVTAHIGALGGTHGTTLIAGTGAVALNVSTTGVRTRIDGWGPILGDEGSGRWIGQTGLIRVLRAIDRRGPQTSLTVDAATLAGTIEDLPRFIGSDAGAAARVARFAPAVLRRATEGDAVATGIRSQAVDLLATAVIAASSSDPVSLVGGLLGDEQFALLLAERLRARGMHVVPPGGDALDGATAMLSHPDLPHERFITRAHA